MSDGHGSKTSPDVYQAMMNCILYLSSSMVQFLFSRDPMVTPTAQPCYLTGHKIRDVIMFLLAHLKPLHIIYWHRMLTLILIIQHVILTVQMKCHILRYIYCTVVYLLVFTVSVCNRKRLVPDLITVMPIMTLKHTVEGNIV